MPIIRSVHCPKCGTNLPDPLSECPRCGVVFAKYHRHDTATVQDRPRLSPSASDGRAFAAALPRAAFLFLIAAWTLSLVSAGVNAERLNSSFLHLPNLVFHEAGHILWMPFGRFMTVLGGSLTQVLVPLVCASALLWQTRDQFGAAVAVWWAGENLLDVAPYINDARDLKLVLLGGKTGAEVEGHDWEYLLNAMGIAYKDHAIAGAVQLLGALTMIAALLWAAFVVLNQLQRRELI